MSKGKSGLIATAVVVVLAVAGSYFYIQKNGKAGADSLGRVLTQPTMTGDVDGNGKIDKADGDLIMKGAVKLIELSASQVGVGDINKDGFANAADVILISQIISKTRDKDKLFTASLDWDPPPVSGSISAGQPYVFSAGQPYVLKVTLKSALTLKPAPNVSLAIRKPSNSYSGMRVFGGGDPQLKVVSTGLDGVAYFSVVFKNVGSPRFSIHEPDNYGWAVPTAGIFSTTVSVIPS